MKKIITTMFVSVLLISVGSKAQTAQPMMKKHGMQSARMQQMLKDSLHLTDVQIDSVMSIREQSAGTMMSIKNDTTLSADQRQQEMKETRKQMKMRMKTILSKDQMQQLEEMQHNMHKGKMQNESSQ